MPNPAPATITICCGPPAAASRAPATPGPVYFCDQHPELVDQVLGESEAIAAAGLRAYSAENDMTLESCFETLLTGLAVRYYNAVAG